MTRLLILFLLITSSVQAAGLQGYNFRPIDNSSTHIGARKIKAYDNGGLSLAAKGSTTQALITSGAISLLGTVSTTNLIATSISAGTISVTTITGSGVIITTNADIRGGSVTGLSFFEVLNTTVAAASRKSLVAQTASASLTDIANLALTDGNIIVGDGSNWVAESTATARISLGIGTIATQEVTNVAILGGSIAGITEFPDEIKTYYVGKHGSDSNDCKTIGKACLTFSHAMDTAISEGPPSSTTPVSIECLDSGVYTVTSTLAVTSYATIYAPSANIVGAVSQNDFSSITFGKISTTTGIALARVTGGSDISSAFIREIDTTGGTSAIGILNTISASDMFVSVDKLRVGTSGFGVGHVGSADGHLHVKINDIELLGNSATGMAVANAAAEIMANIGTIQDKGFTGTTGLNVINGEIHVNVLEMDADTAYTIGASGYLTLNTHQFSGTETNSGQLEMIAMNNGWKGSYSIESTGDTTWARLEASSGVLSNVLSGWAIKTAHYGMSTGDRIIADSVGGSFNVTLPASPAVNDMVEVWDAGSAATNNITVDRNGTNIEGVAANQLINVNRVKITFRYYDASVGWIMDVR